MPRGFSRGYGRGGLVRPPSQRRRTQWELGPGADDIATFDLVTQSASANVIFGSAITPGTSALTIGRLHGFFSLQLMTASAAGDGYNYALSIGVASLDAVTATGTALPDSFDDIDWKWAWHHMGFIGAPLASDAVGTPVDQQMIPIDMKVQRKLGLNEAMFVAGQFGEVGTASLDIRVATRVLVLLP